MEIRNFWVDIEDASGNRIGKGPLRGSQFRHLSRLSASGEFSFIVSVADPNLSALAEKRVAICKYVDRDGALQTFGGGVVDKITRSVAADGSLTITVSGNDLLRELTYRSVQTLDLSGGGKARGGTNPIHRAARAKPPMLADVFAHTDQGVQYRFAIVARIDVG